MTEQSMVEKVARAIEAAAHGKRTPFDPVFVGVSPEELARAAIEAMLVPTEAMEMAGWMAIKDIDIPEAHTAKAWDAMISEALK